MVQDISGTQQALPISSKLTQPRTTQPQAFSKTTRTDTVSFSGTVSSSQAQNIVVDRAYEQLRAVVGEARAALGIPEGETLDTSPEATANRIADFAINFFSKYAENNKLADDKAGRQQFADFIGGAINKGIGEARGILSALSALDPKIESGINQTADYIQGRLNDFVTNGLA